MTKKQIQHEPKQPDDPDQSKRFEDTARELGADESAKAFERVIDDLTKSKKGSTPSPSAPDAPSKP